MRLVNMGKVSKIIPVMIVVLASSRLTAAAFDVDALPEKLNEATEQFLKADAASARALMSKFSDEDLQRVANAFKKSHISSEQRIFWLVEESYRRNAERVAAERIRYLYLAILAALGIIGLFSILTYRQVKK